jgi:hypothetical protein
MTLPSGSAQTAIQLLDGNPEQVRAARALWDTSSGAAGLLDGRNGFTYNPATGRYMRGRARVSDSQLRGYVRNVSVEAEKEMKKTTQQLIAGIIIAAVWYDRMHSLMEALYRTIWLLSIGGFAFDDDRQRNAFYLFVLLQFNWLGNFYYQIRNGAQPLNGLAMNRAGLYASYGNGLWQNVQLEQKIREGKREARRILGSNENHCHDDGNRRGCIELAAVGWQPIGQMVPIGSTTCYTNCLCRIIYR